MGLPRKCDLSSENKQFLYCASGEAAVLFACLFGTLIFIHLIQAILYRRRYCWVIIMAAIWEAGAFALRVQATLDQTKDGALVPSVLLIYLAPILLNAFVYMVFGRMVYYYIPEKKIAGIRAERMALIFVWLDIFAFITQAVGGSMSADDESNVGVIGSRIYTGGIAVQQCFIFCFTGLLIKFHRVMLRGGGIPEKGSQWRVLVYVMYFTLFTITTRIIYRLAEFAQGTQEDKLTVLTTKEVFFYVFEAVPMLFGMSAWNIWHPGRIMVGPEGDFPRLSRKEKKAMRKEKKEQKKAQKQAKKEAKEEELMTLKENRQAAKEERRSRREERRHRSSTRESHHHHHHRRSQSRHSRAEYAVLDNSQQGQFWDEETGFYPYPANRSFT
ncbi:hypothetical protein VTN49DRAFT_512 [Thermomyces lanuginosus]|uniref:uncharacterized protein n=1 Tax=Thermomyces lanuginosus TaxID=5541 RepID=UPI0037429900